MGDDSSRLSHVEVADAGALDGRGLQILQSAASRWGVRTQGIGKVVWFDVVCSAGA